MSKTVSEAVECAHCGAECREDEVVLQDLHFCCTGCRTVYELLSENDLCDYYELEELSGIAPKGAFKGSYDYLNDEGIQDRLLEFTDGQTAVVRLYLPAIHCSSCIWLLEHMDRLTPGILHSEVNFPKKEIRVTYQLEKQSLSQVAEFLAMLGYPPNINLSDLDGGERKQNRTLIYQLGIAAFAFGNVMLLALPEYFGTDVWLARYAPFFRYIMMILSIPVILYSARDYFRSAWSGLRQRYINIDVPIALGISVLFIRSSYEVLSGIAPGYFDSLTGLVFFLLLGRVFQAKTYEHLSFERDYRSYFPVAVTRLRGGTEASVAINELEVGDRIVIRHGEMVPADSRLIVGTALIDNSFVTGESDPVTYETGQRIYAGGTQKGGVIELTIEKPVSQSYLTELWNNDIFRKEKEGRFQNLTNRISAWFTAVVLVIAGVSTFYWWGIDQRTALHVFTAVLIVACPCALALSAPFALGNMLRLFGRRGFYLKSAEVIERLASLTSLVFDKTGTLTESAHSQLEFIGDTLAEVQEASMAALFRQSNHPLSRLISDHLDRRSGERVIEFEEHTGKGIRGNIGGHSYLLGSASFVGAETSGSSNQTRVYVREDDRLLGYFLIKNQYRPGVSGLIQRLKERFKLQVLSGDRSGEASTLKAIFGADVPLLFEQSPTDKLEYVRSQQEEGARVLMIGDGLNDAGALQQSDVGVSLSENINTFSPSCDGILAAESLEEFPEFLHWARKTVRIIYASFALSFAYNLVGMYFAVTGQLSPIVAAILMPLSSITVVFFATAGTNLAVGQKPAPRGASDKS
ncbi:heavy metal translocating P-type ATPase metal-binding domain-containing protein [Cryomorphaceae bacterium]|nr:heavy metal translocating P-type ATPase metal-binding domain-containing protein [Cryomorphaceae bacterium]